MKLLGNRNVSFACAGPGVAMVMLGSVVPSHWYPVPILFAGLVLIATSHVLTPCRDQITRWWRSRISKPT